MTQPLLDFDPCERKHGGDRESKAAFKRVDTDTDMAMILEIIRRSRSGVTLDDVSAAIGRPPNAISGRFTSLKASGQIVATGETRPTRSGASAKIYRAAQ